MHHDGWHQWNDGGWGLGMFVFMFVFWVLAIVAVVVVFRILARDRASFVGPREPFETALDVLKKRYVRGEIDRDEYEQKKRDLES